ncbi:MAG: extracellular solute-binding protein [Chloroflexi bacterium]|nr:extracellular solute-binding protein [Chloroflexota bacterium]
MESKRVNRRQFLCLAGALGGATVLGACAPATPDATQVPDTAPPTEVPEAPTEVLPAGEPAGPEAKVLRINIYTPSEHAERSAENPTVTNAPRILAEKFKEHYPYVEIEWVRATAAPEGVSGDTHYSTWLTALMAGGGAPELIDPSHEIPIQNGWCLPIDEFLAMPNQFAPQYDSWYDVFYPMLMKSLVFGDGNTYCAPVAEPYPGVEVGLAYNQEWLDKIGMEPPKTWTEQKEVCRALKEAGSGLVP